MPLVPLLTLKQFININPRLIGNKAAQISNLYKLKLPVPETAVIPSRVLKEILFFNKLEDKILEQLDHTDWKNPLSVEASSLLIQKQIKTLEYPEDISKQLISSYHQLFKSDFMALRLSPLASNEDAIENAYLNVKGDANLLHSISAVWAGHFQASLLKKRHQEIKSGQFASATIIIQRMIRSDSAGIAFTGDIKNLGKNIISIHSVWGIADKIEQINEVDKFFVNFNSGNIVLRDIAIKHNQHERKLDDLKITKVFKNHQSIASLKDKQIFQIAKYVQKAKVKTLNHIALEWATEKNTVYILGIKNDFLTQEKPRAESQIKNTTENIKTNIKVFTKFSSKKKNLAKINFDGQVYFPNYQAIELLSNPKLLEQEIKNFKKTTSKTVFVLPFVRTIHEYLMLKQKLNRIPLLLELASPAPLLEIDTYLKYPALGFSLNLKSIDLFLKGIDYKNSQINNLYAFDSHLMKKILDQFFKHLHNSDRKVELQVQIEKLDRDFLDYLSRKKITSLLVKPQQVEHCKRQLFEIEERQIINK